MSDLHDPQPPTPPPSEPPPLVIPVRYAPPPPPRPSGGPGAAVRAFLVIVLALSLGLNLLFLMVIFSGLGNLGDEAGSTHITERFYSGDTKSANKIAIMKVDGVIVEGVIGFAVKEIEAAASDPNVKAVVLRIDSPGGSVTASDDLHRRLRQLAKGDHPHQKPENKGKPIVVSMGALAASGGYYIAMPGEYLFAEPSTTTGSIGVYVALPTIEGFAKEHGIGINVMKAGDLKYSGSMFKVMTPQERHMWQTMVDRGFAQFLEVVEEGRPKLKDKLTEVVIREEIGPDGNVIPKDAKVEDGKPPQVQEYIRRRADGGIWTASEALKYGLIDAIGYQDDAVQKAKSLAGLDTAKVVIYEQPSGLVNRLLGAQSQAPKTQLDPARLAAAATPRLWFLAPQSELAGILTAVGR
jgi:protease-4